MLGGVIVNFIFVFIIYIGMVFVYGDMFVVNVDLKDGVLIENFVMFKIGFKIGDKILVIDGKKVENFDNELNMNIIMFK